MTAESNNQVPVETLLAMLRTAGFKNISTREVLDIQKVLSFLDVATIRDYKRLKYYIAPIVCRNKEDQEKFNEIFNRYSEWVEENKFSQPPPLPSKKNAWIKWAVIATVVACVIGYFLWRIIPNLITSSKPYLTLSQTSYNARGHFSNTAIGDSVEFTASLHDTIPGKTYSVSWLVNGNQFPEARNAKTVFKDTGNYMSYIYVRDKNKNIILKDSISTRVNCEHLPSAEINVVGAQPWTYQILFGDSMTNTNQYNYKWYINDSLAGIKKELSTNYDAEIFTVRVVISNRNKQCGEDSIVAQLDKRPAISLAAVATVPATIITNFQTANLFWILLLMLLLPALITWLVYKFPGKKSVKDTSQKKQVVQETNETPDREEGPFFIEFKNQDHNISPDEQISQLADGLRKRQFSDALALNIKKTITSTINAGGFPTFQFSPRTKPVDFLILIDKEYPDSYTVKLFEYLVDRLKAEQVNITVYDYYKEPLYLNNKRHNHIHIPLDRLAQLYPDTVLIMFTSGHLLLEPLKPQLKSWVKDKLQLWPHQLIITPVPKKDWTYKELLIQQSGIMIVPADIYQNDLLRILLDSIRLQIETTKQSKVEIPSAYTSRFFNFQEFEELRKYLNNDNLLKWISATAVYPNVDWAVTLAIGKALEEQQPAAKEKLVTYQNLLKISRISWTQDAVIDDTLRLDMLRYIDNNTEAIARRAVLELLNEIAVDYKENSFAKDEYDLYKNSNKIFLHGYDSRNPVTTEEIEAVKNYSEKKYLDWAQLVYHEEGYNTLLTAQSNDRSFSLKEFLNTIQPAEKKDDTENQEKEEGKIKKRKISREKITAAGVFIFTALCGYFILNTTNKLQLQQPTGKDFSIQLRNNYLLNNTGTLSLNLSTAGSNYTADRQNDSLFYFKNINLPNNDQGSGPMLTLLMNDVALSEVSISPDSSYIVNIEKRNENRRPLLIRYNNAQTFATMQTQIFNLLSAYSIDARLSAGISDSSYIRYYTSSQKGAADSIANRIKTYLGLNILVEQRNNATTSTNSLELFLNLNKTKTVDCNIIAIKAIPASIGDIWSGDKNNRLVNIDLNRSLIFYSTQANNTFGTYVIEKICFSTDGIYRLITRADKEYQVFFIRNISTASIDLSTCPARYATAAEAELATADKCGSFNRMHIYYANTGAGVVWVNTAGLVNYSTDQRDKLNNIFNNINATAIITITVNINSSIWGNTINSRYNNIRGNFPLGSTRALNSVAYNIRQNNIQWKLASFKGTPFDRDFVTITINNPPIEDPCSKIYYSMQEALNVKDPSLICRLNLEKEQLTQLPEALFKFTKMQELNLGSTTIPENSIDRLQKALPGCKIIYTRAPQTSVETSLGEIQTDQKGFPDKAGLSLISNISSQLKQYRQSKIRLEAIAYSKLEQSTLESALRDITNLFYKEGVPAKSNQISQKINLMQQQQQQQANIPNIANTRRTTFSIRVIGINWPEENKKAAY